MPTTPDKQRKRFTTRDMAVIAVLTALGFAANFIQFPIPTPLGPTRFHLGNVICLLSGFLLGPIPGGLAAGFGAMFYDFTDPRFISEAWITFLMKFAMAFLCGKISWAKGAEGMRLGRNIAAAVAASLLYVLLYLSKEFIMNYLFLRMELTPVLITLAQKGGVSLINGALSTVIVIPLSSALQAALARANLHLRPRR